MNIGEYCPKQAEYYIARACSCN